LVEQFVKKGLRVAFLETIQHEIKRVFRLDGEIDRMRIGGAAGGIVAGFRDDYGLTQGRSTLYTSEGRC